MRDFFHGWRRKAGCVFLVMVAALFVEWLRCRIYEDCLTLRMSRTADVSIYFQHDSIECGYEWETDEKTDGAGSTHFDNLIHWRTSERPSEDDRLQEVFPTRNFFIFRIRSEGWKALRSNGMDVSCREEILCIPFTPTMLMVTLLSGYLILRPGKRVGKQVAKD
ncbi:MAG: hypothetical protein JSS49_22635 [Planctomycetes bacterium]|nr:hypothetical protein [Planctomycetota bacterium]